MKALTMVDCLGEKKGGRRVAKKAHCLLVRQLDIVMVARMARK